MELAQPDEHEFSREVYVSEFTAKYNDLVLGNGGSWCRDDGALAKRFNIKCCLMQAQWATATLWFSGLFLQHASG